ncbi:hypothetical protein XPA_000913 [Xanthoria parietina]
MSGLHRCFGRKMPWATHDLWHFERQTGTRQTRSLERCMQQAGGRKRDSPLISGVKGRQTPPQFPSTQHQSRDNAALQQDPSPLLCNHTHAISHSIQQKPPSAPLPAVQSICT